MNNEVSNVARFLELEGNTNDLLMVNSDNSMKCTRLIRLDPKSTEENEEIIDICVTSTNIYSEHPMFDKLLGKKIRMIIEILD